MDQKKSSSPVDQAIAERALSEAQERRGQKEREPQKQKEINGPQGLEPTRYHDWEVKGIAVDF